MGGRRSVIAFGCTSTPTITSQTAAAAIPTGNTTASIVCDDASITDKSAAQTINAATIDFDGVAPVSCSHSASANPSSTVTTTANAVADHTIAPTATVK